MLPRCVNGESSFPPPWVEPGWDRFPIFAQRFLLAQQKVDPEQLEVFLASLRSKLEEILEHVGARQLDAFREKSVAESVRVAGEYLR